MTEQNERNQIFGEDTVAVVSSCLCSHKSCGNEQTHSKWSQQPSKRNKQQQPKLDHPSEAEQQFYRGK
jgi:hypothetical protein